MNEISYFIKVEKTNLRCTVYFMYYADVIKGDLYINIIYINIYEKEKHSSINTKFQAQMVVKDVRLKNT